MSLRRRPRPALAVRVMAIVTLVLWGAGLANAQPTPPSSGQDAPSSKAPSSEESLSFDTSDIAGDLRSGLAQAAVRLPLAALFGTALALRPRRASSPPRDPAVIETQIVLAIVGAMIMIIVGASLARLVSPAPPT